MENIEPFTLRWWLHKMVEAIGRFDGHRSIGNGGGARRYKSLAIWIEKRIINKYEKQ